MNPADPQTRRETVRSLLAGAVFWFVTLLYLETVLHVIIFGGLTLRYLYLMGFTAVIALVLAGLMLFTRRINANLATVLVTALSVVYASEIVYYHIFGSLYSLSMISLGGDAVTAFWKETLLTIREHLPSLILTILPIPAVCLVRKFFGDTVFAPVRKPRLLLLVLAAAVHLVLLLTLHIGGTGFFTVYSVYHGSDATIGQTTDTFGLATAWRLELQHMLRGDTATETGYFVEPDAGLEQTETEYGWNVLDIDFDALNALTDDEKVRALNDYCASLTGTRKNEYTGMLKDYNLIVLCAESFSTAAIDPELTPTLYKLSHEGIVFNNYYNTYPNTTTDGEYSLCMGLFPDTTRGKTASSFYASRDIYLPLCLGNLFSQQRGIQSYGYHNYYGSYYGRYLTHPNMGYQMKFAGQGMTFTTSWPASDLEMLEQSLPDYLSQDQFHAYYMTFSGHYKYNTSVNPMAERNYAQVKDLPYSEAGKCYLSCNIELEKAMAYLMDQLEQAGVADRTAIVLAGDHYPYGLTDDEYDELIGHETGYFERYKDTLIFWVGGLEEPIVVDEYCCNVDILPTILNLWGFDYDSRLLAGTDVFSGGTHAAILIDQSFLTERVWFNANTNTATWLGEEDDAYLQSMIRLVKNKFSFSTDILNTAYYNFVFDQGTVTINTDGWITEEEWNGTATTTDDQSGTEETQDPPSEELPPEEPVDGEVPAEDTGVPEEQPPVEEPPVDGEAPAEDTGAPDAVPVEDGEAADETA